MIGLVIAIHVVISLFLVLVVLLQQGQGADLSVFGGGATQTAFGARSAANILHKLTVGGFAMFLLTTMAIGFLQSSGTGSSVMAGVAGAVEESVVDEVPAPPADLVEEAAGAVEGAMDAGTAEAGDAAAAAASEVNDAAEAVQDAVDSDGAIQ